MNTLRQIALKRTSAVEAEKNSVSMAAMVAKARASRIPHPVLPLFSQGPAKLIAEIKCASPSAGSISKLSDEQCCEIAGQYLENGAAMISVLTEPEFFGGSDHRLKLIRKTFPDALLLMKDFIVDEYQIAKARVLGADAILLIVAMLTEAELIRFYEFAKEMSLTALVEVHNLDELRRAETLGAKFIGVNNRDLTTLEVSLATSEELRHHAAKDAVLISESGFKTTDDIAKIASLGYAGFLVGEVLMRSDSPGFTTKSFVEAMSGKNKSKVKYCGITNLEDALLAEQLGADYLGFIFAPQSPRYIEPVAAAEIARKLKKATALVGVFVNAPADDVNHIANQVGLSIVQLHGDEDLAYGEKISRPLFRSARTLDEVAFASKFTNLEGILVDGFHPDKRGGTGIPCDDETTLAASKVFNLIIAGGLTPENIAATIAKFKPYCVDVSSGIEIAPGKKDPAKMTAFMAAARSSYEN